MPPQPTRGSVPPQRSRRKGRRTHEGESVLLLGNYLPSLAAVRSLAAAGYRTIAGDGGEFSTVAWSRDCHEVWEHPQVRDSDAFLGALTDFLSARPEVSVVLPLQERYVALLAREHHRLPTAPLIASPAPEVVLTCLEKERMYAIAREVGVASRPVVLSRDPAELAAAAHEVGFPCVIRPTGEPGQLLPGDRKAIICRDHAALDSAFSSWPEGRATLMVQPYVPGPRHNVAFAARQGRILARVQTTALRTDRPDGTGLGVEDVSVAPDPRLVRACDALIGHLGYTGVGLAQFLVPAHEAPHFLELNPRLGIALALIVDCGLDLTRAAVGLASESDGWEPARDFRYPVGRRYAWTTGDLHALRMTRAKGSLSAAESLRWLARTIRAAARADVHATWSWRDPKPTLAILAQLLPGGPWKRVPLRDRPVPASARPMAPRLADGSRPARVIEVHGHGTDRMPIPAKALAGIPVAGDDREPSTPAPPRVRPAGVQRLTGSGEEEAAVAGPGQSGPPGALRG